MGTDKWESDLLPEDEDWPDALAQMAEIAQFEVLVGHSAHLTDEQIQGYLSRSVSAKSYDRFMEHFMGCADCAARCRKLFLASRAIWTIVTIPRMMIVSSDSSEGDGIIRPITQTTADVNQAWLSAKLNDEKVVVRLSLIVLDEKNERPSKSFWELHIDTLLNVEVWKSDTRSFEQLQPISDELNTYHIDEFEYELELRVSGKTDWTISINLL